MLVNQLINNDIPTLRTDDTVGKALDLMQSNGLQQLALVRGKEFVCMIDEFQLEDFDEDTLLLEIITHESVVFSPSQHLLEVLGQLDDNIDLYPVVAEEHEFLGVVTKKDLFNQLGKQLNLKEIGAIIVISLNARDYSLAEITRLIEADNCKILSSFLTGNLYEVENPLKLTLKLNKEDITSVVATLERFGYQVSAAFSHQPIESLEQERYGLLMKYLNI